MQPLENLSRRIEGLSALDPVADRVANAVSSVSHRPVVACRVGGHAARPPLHPVLTDLPIGSWTSAFFLDLFGGASARRARGAWSASGS